MHFRGEGKTEKSFLFATKELYFTRCTSGGKAKAIARWISGVERFYPMHFRGEGKTRHPMTRNSGRFYPMHFRGEGKTEPILLA